MITNSFVILGIFAQSKNGKYIGSIDVLYFLSSSGKSMEQKQKLIRRTAKGWVEISTGITESLPILPAEAFSHTYIDKCQKPWKNKIKGRILALELFVYLFEAHWSFLFN